MLPHSTEARLSLRARLSQRLGGVAVAANGAVFLIQAWDGFDTHAAAWTIVANIVLGIVQVASLAWRRSESLFQRLPFVLAAVGMAVSALASVHHRSGIAYAYVLAGGLNVFLAIYGPDALRRMIRRRRE